MLNADQVLHDPSGGYCRCWSDHAPVQLGRTKGAIAGYMRRTSYIALLLCLFPLQAAATDFYVRAGGSDGKDGRTPGTALRTIGHAAQLLENNGDRVIVGPGVYGEGNIAPSRSGIANMPIVFLADPSGSITGDVPGSVLVVPPEDQTVAFQITGQRYVVIDGFTILGTFDAGIQVRSFGQQNSTEITIRNVEVRSSTKRGIDIAAKGRIVVENNRVFVNESSGIVIEGCVTSSLRCFAEASGSVTPVASGNLIEGNGAAGLFVSQAEGGVIQSNIIVSNEGTGVTLRAANNTLVVNNLIYANKDDGIAMGTADLPVTGVTIVNNTVYRNGGWAVHLGSAFADSPSASIFNNIFQDNLSGGITLTELSTRGYVSGFNINTDGYGKDTPFNIYDLPADPLFEDPAGPDGILGGAGYADDDFRLVRGVGAQPSSPAINAGSTTVDVLGLTGSTATDGGKDTDIVDLGFHYGASATQEIRAERPYMPIFVRQSGDDQNEGKNPENAMASVKAATRKAEAGVTLVVGPGRYFEGEIEVLANAGRIDISADPGGFLTGDQPDPVLIDASGGQTGFVFLKAPYLLLEGFHVAGAVTAGIQVRSGSDHAELRNNVVFSIGKRGIDVQEANDVKITNNLAYANGTGGIQVGGLRPLVQHNTAYGNGANGIQIGVGDFASPGARVEFNITHMNGKSGMQLHDDTRYPLSLPGYVSRYNTVTDGYGTGTPKPATDLRLDPLFVNPSGLDGLLGGEGFADDQFHLSQGSAGQTVNSPAVDYAPLAANRSEVAGRSTRTDGIVDSGLLDLGFHYPPTVIDVIYVSPEGSDDNSGFAESRPLKTIAEALRRSQPGGTVRLAPGSYPGSGLRPPAGLTIVGSTSALPVVDAGGKSTVFDVREADVTIANVAATGAADSGIRVVGDRFQLMNSWVFSNAGKGVFLSDGQEALLFNNVVYGNGNSGLVIGGGNGGPHCTAVANNTIYGNANRGITVGLVTTMPNVGTLIANNVISGNQRAGVDIGEAALDELSVHHNCNADGYAGIATPAADSTEDPLLVGMPGGEAVPSVREFDVGLHLAQVPAGQPVTSPCVDRGLGLASVLGLDRSSTRTDGEPDSGWVDMGYHYGAAELNLKGVRNVLRKDGPNSCQVLIDCDGDGRLMVHEMILGVNLALGNVPLSVCPSFDLDGDGAVGVAELITGLNQALNRG
jgi:parallel beta-helix repeat protein